MPHDTHTTHEPDRVGREGDEIARSPGFDDDSEIHRQPTMLMFGGFPAQDRDPAPALN